MHLASTPSTRVALLLLCALAACSDPNNRVVGGINSTPPLAINAVRSSIFAANATSTDTSGGTQSINIVALSGSDDLCAKLTANPDLFKSTATPFTATMLLMTPPNRLGSFYFQPSANVASTYAASDGDGQPPLVVVGVAGYISLGEFDAPSGNGTGTFDVLFSDSAGNRFETYGNFKSTYCKALETAFIPRFN